LTPAPASFSFEVSLRNQQKSGNDFGKVWEWGKIWNIVKSTIEVLNDFHCRKVKNGVKTWISTFYSFLIEILRCFIYYSSLSSISSVLNIFSNFSNVLRFGSMFTISQVHDNTIHVITFLLLYSPNHSDSSTSLLLHSPQYLAHNLHISYIVFGLNVLIVF
jgi:hypothetical protein